MQLSKVGLSSHKKTMVKKEKRGGAHNMAGQPLKYTIEMKAITIRVPLSYHPKIKKTEKQIKSKYLIKK